MPRISLFVALACVLGCPPGSSAPPPTDSCASPSAGSADSLEIGAATSADLAGQPAAFVPLHDGDGVSLLRGGQGLTMLGLIVHTTGAGAPSCMGQTTAITDGTGARVTSSTAPLTTYAQPDGTRLTHPMWLPADYPTSFVVTTSAAGQSLALHLHLLLAK